MEEIQTTTPDSSLNRGNGDAKKQEKIMKHTED
jgi:hypothetical protein